MNRCAKWDRGRKRREKVEGKAAPGDDLQGNSEPARCADCGTAVPPHAGHCLYVGDGAKVLCASYYQRHMLRDAGGSTHDLDAEVGGGSG